MNEIQNVRFEDEPFNRFSFDTAPRQDPSARIRALKFVHQLSHGAFSWRMKSRIRRSEDEHYSIMVR